MAQDPMGEDPTAAAARSKDSTTFQVKAGFPSDPKPMEVHVPAGDIKPWDADSWARFEQMGKPRPRVGGPAQGHRQGEVHVRRQAAGDALRPDGRGRDPGRRDRLDRHLEGRGAARREGGVDGRLADRPVRRAGRGRGGRGLARGGDGRGSPREGDLQGEAVHPRAARGDEGRRAARLRPRPEPRRPERPAQGQRGRPHRRPGRPRRRREGLRRGRGRPRGDVLLRGPHPFLSRDPRHRGLLGGRPAHRLRLDPGHLRGPRGPRRGPRPRPQERAGDLRAHGRRLRQQGLSLRHRQRLRAGRVQDGEEGRGPGQADAGPQAGAAVHGQRPQRADQGQGRREEGRHAHRRPLRLLRGGGGHHRGRDLAPGDRAPRQEPEPQDRELRRLHEHGPGRRPPRARQLAGGLRHRVGDRRARREARDGPHRDPEEERGEPGPAGPVRHRGEGDRLGPPQQEGRRHVDRRPRPGEGGEEARPRHGERHLERQRLRQLERPAPGAPRRLGGGDRRHPGPRDRLPDR